MFCDNLEACDEVGDGRKVEKGGDLHIPMTNLCYYMAETNIIL